MYNLIVADTVLEKIRTFVDILLDGYLLRFTDTGMGEAEVVIRDNYIFSADALADTIYTSLESFMQRDIIPYSFEGPNKKSSTRIGSRSLTIRYTEDTENMTRYITDIEILRK